MDTYFKENIEINSKSVVKKSRKSILQELDDIASCNDVSLPSSLLSRKTSDKEDKKGKKKDIDIDGIIVDDESEMASEGIDSDWVSTITSFKSPKTKKKKANLFSGFDPNKKGKKKKKQKEGQRVSHKKDFEPEMALLKNLQMDQSRFVDSLQKRYDQMEGTKSTARGIGKYTTDLINSITQARSVSLQLTKEIINTKKTIADLEFKERKEFGGNGGSEQTNMANYASTYLKQVMSVGRNNLMASTDISADDYIDDLDDTDDLFSSLDENLGETDRSKDVDTYLKYENDNVEIKVLWYDSKADDDPDKYEFVAYTQKGEELDDYPLPEKTKLSINRATGKATDKYGAKYNMIIL